jgi:hypothetical protein
MLYVTYQQNGVLKRGVLSQSQYEKYCKDPSISNIQIHANQTFMENYFNQQKGISSNPKSFLLG